MIITRENIAPMPRAVIKYLRKYFKDDVEVVRLPGYGKSFEFRIFLDKQLVAIISAKIGKKGYKISVIKNYKNKLKDEIIEDFKVFVY